MKVMRREEDILDDIADKKTAGTSVRRSSLFN